MSTRWITIPTLYFLLAAFPFHAPSPAPPQLMAQDAMGSVAGRIQGAEPSSDLSQVQVVLVKFLLNEKGMPQGKEVQNHTADAAGRYAFKDIPLTARAVFRLTARVDGNELKSTPFTFPEGQRALEIDLQVPKLVGDATALRITEGLIAMEPHRGGVMVTEVIHLANPTPDIIEGVRNPLQLSIPGDAENLEMVQGVRKEDGYERLGAKLLVYLHYPPGRTTLAFRYRLPVALGAVSLEKRYPRPVGALTVLVPEGGLSMDGGLFSRLDVQEIQGTRYDAWSLKEIAADAPVRMRLTGVPMRQEVMLLPLAGFFVLMGGIVIWFLRKRLAPTAASS